MAYTKTTWVDRLVQYANRFTKSNETSTSVTLTADPGTVTQAGTPISAVNMNKIEQGIADAHTNIDNHIAATTAHGATSAATANRIALRDANGQINVNTPTANTHVTTKTYVDTAVSAKANANNPTFTGTVTLPGDPTTALGAATKQYVDGRFVTGTYTGDGTASRNIALPFTPSAVLVWPKDTSIMGTLYGQPYGGLVLSGSPLMFNVDGQPAVALQINGAALTVSRRPSTGGFNDGVFTNNNGQVYHYIAFR